MARATRSSAAQEKEKTTETPPSARKIVNKKRKRTSTTDGLEQPAAKVSRMDDDIKEEDNQDSHELPAEESMEPELPSSGDVPVRTEDAEKILEVLETYVLPHHSLLGANTLPPLLCVGLILKVSWTVYSHCQRQSTARTQLLQAPQQVPSRTRSVHSSNLLLNFLFVYYV